MKKRYNSFNQKLEGVNTFLRDLKSLQDGIPNSYHKSKSRRKHTSDIRTFFLNQRSENVAMRRMQDYNSLDEE